MHFKPVDSRDVSVCVLRRYQCWVDLEHDVVKGGTKVRAIDGSMPRGLGVIDVFASNAVELNGLLVWDISLAHRQ